MSTPATSNLLYRLSETPEGTRLAFTHTVAGPFPEQPPTAADPTGRAVYVQGRGTWLWADFFIDSGPGVRGAHVIDLEGRSIAPGSALPTAGRSAARWPKA